MISHNKVGLKLLTALANDLAWHYHVAKIRQLVGTPEHSVEIRSSQYKFEKEEQLIHAFELILSRMIPEHRDIVMNDFVQKKHPYWWQERYSRSSYYRLKFKGLSEFTSFFEIYLVKKI